MTAGRHGCPSVIAEIESSDGHRFFRLPMTDAKFTFFMFFQFGACGDEAKFARPLNGEVVGGKLGGVTEMRVPTLPGANEQNAVSRVFDHVAAIMKMKSEFLLGCGNKGENDVQIIVAAHAALLKGHSFILEKFQGLAVLCGNAVDGQCAGKLKNEDAFAAGFRAKVHGNGSVERVVGEN